MTGRDPIKNEWKRSNKGWIERDPIKDEWKEIQ